MNLDALHPQACESEDFEACDLAPPDVDVHTTSADPLEDGDHLAAIELSESEDDDPPFDPPDEDDEIFSGGVPPPDEEDAVEADERLALVSDRPLALTREPERRTPERPAPAITIHVSWDSPTTAGLAAGMAADRRVARTEITQGRGGVEGAVNRFSGHPSPDLLVLETTLSASAMIAGLNRLFAVIPPTTKVVVIGAVNDVGLLRGLSQRGVSQYILAPVRQDELIRTICDLYADSDHSRVIAVIGARGGVGASAIAHSLAWCIGERMEMSATLVDLDHAFSKAAFDEHLIPQLSIADGILAPESVDDVFIERVTNERSRRFRVLGAPPTLARELDFDAGAVKALIDKVRRTTSYVVLDLPHLWSAWVRETLLGADEVLIIAAPDLSSMRNTKNIVDQLKTKRSHDREPLVALSMVGAPKRPEISARDFAEAVGTEPVASFAFEPELFGLSEIKGLTVVEMAPQSKAAETIEALASSFTGRKPVRRKPVVRSEQPARLPERQEKDVAPAMAAAQSEQPANEPDRRSQPDRRRRPDRRRKDVGTAKAADQAPRPFTFAPPADPLPETADPTAPLLLNDVALEEAPPSAPASTKPPRRARASGEAQRKRSHGRPGTLRAAAAIAALVIAGGWYAQSRDEAAARASTAAAEHSVAAAAVQSAPPARVEDPAAQYESALRLIRDGDFQEGVTLLRRAAESGLPVAQFRLAKLYETGTGVPLDLAMARRWTERAASAGDSRAMHDLGVYFARGEGGAQNDTEAFRWFRQAAEYDVAASQYNLGLLYEQGRGVSANASEALFWYLLAARQGDEGAAARVAEVQGQLTPQQIEQAQARAQAFNPHPTASPQGLAD